MATLVPQNSSTSFPAATLGYQDREDCCLTFTMKNYFLKSHWITEVAQQWSDQKYRVGNARQKDDEKCFFMGRLNYIAVWKVQL